MRSGGPSEASRTLSLDQLLALGPGRIRLPAGGSDAEYFFGSLFATSRFLYSRSPDGNTLAHLALSIPPVPTGEEGKVAPLGFTHSVSIQERAGGEVIARFRSKLIPDPAWDASSGDPMRLQTEFALPPGAYRIEWSLLDPQGHRGSAFGEDLTVPDFRVGLLLSDIFMGPASEGDASGSPSSSRPPLADLYPVAEFPLGRKISLHCDAYNAVRRGKEVDLGVKYETQLRTKMEFQTVGKPLFLRHVTNQSLAHVLDPSGWPEGEYRIRIQVTDNLNGSTTSREESFRLVSPESSRAK